MTARRTRARTMLGELGRQLSRVTESGDAWTKYRDDPLGFFHEALGFQPWAKQADIARSLIAGDFVTVVSANGVGKTKLGAAIALWFWRTRGPGCRVILTSATAAHVGKALWKETRELYYGAKKPLGGTIAMMATTGLRDEDGRELFGITAETVESFQGLRARDLCIIADESSGIGDDIFGAMIANLSGGGRFLLIGNGMRSTGFFAETHKNERYARFAISALESPNVASGKIVIPGLVTSDWVRDREREWGRESPWFKIRVLGQFVTLVEGALFPPDLVAAAEQRWAETPATGRLVIGIDPAGSSGTGDESVFVTRRGKRVIRMYSRRGLTPDDHVTIARGMFGEDRGDSREPPLVVIDRDGRVGAEVWGAFISAQQAAANSEFQLEGVRGGERAQRKPNDIHARRDEMFFSLLDWLRDGGAIPVDAKLEAELAAIATDATIRGLAKVTPKDDLRAALRRSPDRADALALAAWEVPTWTYEAARTPEPVRRPLFDVYDGGYKIDPWAGVDSADPWGGKRDR